MKLKIAIIIGLFAVPLYGSHYVLRKSTFSGSGGSGGSQHFFLKFSAGQNVAGGSAGSSYVEQAGFYTYSTVVWVGVKEPGSQTGPLIFKLSSPFPNPTPHEVKIRYEVPRVSRIRIVVYDAAGRLVRTLVDGTVRPGVHLVTWNGMSNANTRVAQGVYFIRMVAPGYMFTKKVIVLK